MRTSVLTNHVIAALVLTAIIAVPLPCIAFEFVVGTTTDTNDGLCTPVGSMIQMPCSLREAIIKANDYEGTDTINIPAGTYHLSIFGSGENQAATGDLDVLDNVNIVGAGSGVTRIVGDIGEQIFAVLSPLAPTSTTLLQLSDLTISDNRKGITALYGNVYLWRTVVENCQNPAVSSNYGTVLIVDSVIRGNSGGYANSILAVNGTLLVIRSTVSGNTVDGTPVPGVISCQGSTVGFTNSTITGNQFVGDPSAPGGFYGSNCATVIDSSTVVGNLPYEIGVELGNPGSTTIRNTYIHGPCSADSTDHLTSEGGNVRGNAYSCDFDHPTDISAPGSSLVMPLGYFGGYTPVMLPYGVGSDSHPHPLVDNPNADANCQLVDQRGISRPQDGGEEGIACDTGAVERTPTDYIFYWGDGFETGDTSRWDITFPPQ